VLNGIGGRTVAEAKRNISCAEFWQWCAYIEKRGSLNPSLRLERAIARLAQLFLQSQGVKNVSFYDLLPHEEAPLPPPATLEQALKEWS